MKQKSLIVAVLIDIALVIVVGLTRVLSASKFLHKWDSVQFALALSDYDITRHQPHPPGYPGYIALGWLSRRIIPDDNAALVAVGIVSAIILAIAVHHIGRILLGERGGFFAGLIASLNPLLWYFSSIALAYIPGIAVATLAAWASLGAKGRAKWIIPVLAGFASVIWLPAGILVAPLGIWAMLQRDPVDEENPDEDENGIESTSPIVAIIGYIALFLLPVIVCYLPAIMDTGGWAGYIAQIQSESGKHVLRFSRWLQNPFDEFSATTGSIAQFFEQGLGIGRWLFLALLIPITNEKGCPPRMVIGLLPLLIAGFVVLHYSEEAFLQTAGVIVFILAVAYLLPSPTTLQGRIRRSFFIWWLAPGLLLFVFLYVNYVGILTIFLPGLILLEAWAIERAATFMMLQTIREPVPEGNEESEEIEEEGNEKPVPAAKSKGPDLKVGQLVAWLLIVLVAMHEVGVFIDDTPVEEDGIDAAVQESLIGIMARDIWLGEVIDGVKSVPVPRDKLIILGGEDDYRHWTYYLPESRSIWTKYLLYNPIRENTTVWVSQNRIQNKISPEISEIDDRLKASYPLDNAEALIVFPDEMALLAGTKAMAPIMPGDQTDEDEEPLCWLVSMGDASEIVFTEGSWWLE